jgi:hypothetical protein
MIINQFFSESSNQAGVPAYPASNTVYPVTGHGNFSAWEPPGDYAFLIVSALFLASCRSGPPAPGIYAGTGRV